MRVARQGVTSLRTIQTRLRAGFLLANAAMVGQIADADLRQSHDCYGQPEIMGKNEML
jgi:hypothetical protein